MKLGIVGLPNVGKSTLFNAITNAGAESANYPFCTIDPNVGVVAVPDSRLDWLSDFHKPKKTTPAVVEFVDIAGLVKGASKGEGLGNKFLSNIRATDAIVHVVRCFDDPNVIHVEGSTDPLRDIQIIDIELIMADMEMVQRRIDKCSKAGRTGDKKAAHEAEVFQGLQDWLNEGRSARSYECGEDDAALIATAELLSLKPIIYAANLDEAGFSDYQNNATTSRWRVWPPPRARRSSPSAPSWRPRSPSWSPTKKSCSWTTWASPSPAWTGSSRPAMPCWASSPSSPPVRTSAGPGPSKRVPRRPRLPVRSTPTSSGALSGPRWSPSTTW